MGVRYSRFIITRCTRTDSWPESRLSASSTLEDPVFADRDRLALATPFSDRALKNDKNDEKISRKTIEISIPLFVEIVAEYAERETRGLLVVFITDLRRTGGL